MSRLDLMTDDQVINWIKRRITIITLMIITLVLLLYSKVIASVDSRLLDKFIIVSIIVYLISILYIKFFLDKLIFNLDANKKSKMAKSIRDKYKK